MLSWPLEKTRHWITVAAQGSGVGDKLSCLGCKRPLDTGSSVICLLPAITMENGLCVDAMPEMTATCSMDCAFEVLAGLRFGPMKTSHAG